ncbi:MAG: Sir2 family NAD-dependent protein deacetylase, partial [Pseudomonadota bacterium]
GEGAVLVVTQNIDDLHERAGSRAVHHMHGELRKSLCAHCGARERSDADLSPALSCGSCGRAGGMRPDVVWFGEMPYGMDMIWDVVRQAELFVSIGTSGHVYPAAAFVGDARRAGVATLELNMERTSPEFLESRQGPATEIVPAWVDEVLAAA